MPWLQDVDGDGDGRSDVWLNSWDVEYRDVLIVDGQTITTEEMASAGATTIASFYYDANDNGESDAEPAALFKSFTFLAGYDWILSS